jgi:diadenosine tetraphosphate (Ap4A) HIT family hydrolase
MKKLVNKENARRGKYATVIEGIAACGVCPFCLEHLRTYHKNPLIERAYWWVTNSMYPYHPVCNHILLILKEHREHIEEISQEAWSELQEIITELTKERKIAGGAFVLRFGDTRFTGASVAHVHAHLIQSDPEHADYGKEKKITAGVVMRIG